MPLKRMKSVGRNVENDIFNPKRNDDVLAGKKEEERNDVLHPCCWSHFIWATPEKNKRDSRSETSLCVTCEKNIIEKEKNNFFPFFSNVIRP